MARWRIASRVDHPDPADANVLALADLDGGADTLVLVSADAPNAFGFGVPLTEAGAVEAVLAGVSVDLVGLRLDLGRDGMAAVARIAAVLAQRGHPPAHLDWGLDPVSWLAHDGRLSGDWPAVARSLTRCIEDLDARGFGGPKLRADGRPWHAAGASEAQELGAVVASGVLYLRTLEAAGVDLERARASLSFGLAAECDLVATVAKVRALRRLWGSVETACGLQPRPIEIHCDTAWRSMTAASSPTNIVRSAAAVVAAVLGGADGVTVVPHTLPLGLPDADARRIARNTHHVLSEESQLWRVADAASGAEVFEAATQALGEEAWAEMQAIEREDGIVACLLGGRLGHRIGVTRQARRDRLEAGHEILVGVNRFAAGIEDAAAVLQVERRVPAAMGPAGLPPMRWADAFEPGGAGR